MSWETFPGLFSPHVDADPEAVVFCGENTGPQVTGRVDLVLEEPQSRAAVVVLPGTGDRAAGRKRTRSVSRYLQ